MGLGPSAMDGLRRAGIRPADIHVVVIPQVRGVRRPPEHDSTFVENGRGVLKEAVDRHERKDVGQERDDPAGGYRPLELVGVHDHRLVRQPHLDDHLRL